eukprot:3958193-Amphidinium_carterae.3
MVEVNKVSCLATRPPSLHNSVESVAQHLRPDAVASFYFSYVPMAAASQQSYLTLTFGATPNWPNLLQGLILAVCNEVGGEPHMFDVVEYFNAEKEEQCRCDPSKAYLNYHPVLKEAD